MAIPGLQGTHVRRGRGWVCGGALLLAAVTIAIAGSSVAGVGALAVLMGGLLAVWVVRYSRTRMDRKAPSSHLNTPGDNSQNLGLSTLLSRIPCGVMLVGEDRVIRWANDYARDLARCDGIDELCGKICHEHLCPTSQHDCPVWDRGESVDNSVRILRRHDGVELPILKTVTEIQVNDETMLLETFVDLSKQVDAAAATQRALDEQQAIFETSLVGVMVLENRIITKVNRRMAEMLGYEPDDLVGRGPESLHLSMEHFHDFGAKYYWRLAEHEVVQIEYPLRHRDGHAVWCQFNGRAVAPPDLSKGAVWIIDDITERKQIEQALQASEGRFRDVLHASDDAIMLVEDGRIVDCNFASGQMLGYLSREELIGTHVADLSPATQPDGQPSAAKAAALMSMAGEQGYHRFEWTHLRAGGQDIPVEVSLTPIVFEGRNLFHAVCRDISASKRTESQLRKLSQAVEQMAPSVVITDAQGTIEYVNPAFTENTGYAASEVIGQNPRLLKGGEVEPEAYERMWRDLTEGRTWRGEFHNRRKDGSLFWELATIAPIRDDRGQITHFVAVKEEISRRKAAEQDLLTAARTDHLTGLANRTGFGEFLDQALARQRKDPTDRFAVLFLDFDRFKIINDSLGHDIGDLVLREIAGRLQEALGASHRSCRHMVGHALARFGGDEFVVMLDGVRDWQEAARAAEGALRRLAQPYQVGGYQVYSTASIGIRMGSTDDAGAADILRDADTAMYEAKIAGRGCYRLFDDSMRDRVHRRLSLESDLRHAIGHDELFLAYQPIVCLRTGQVANYEALVRWRHPTHGLIQPGEFIGIAEETGIIHEIGTWVIHQACRELSKWQQSGGPAAHASVSINLSRNQLMRPGLTEEVRQALDACGLAAEALHLEVTESSVMRDVEMANRHLTELAQMGVTLAMDDFGTGHSSLACLHELPFKVLKIDRSFVLGLSRNREIAAMIHAVASLAENLSIQVVAEGIETLDQLALIQAIDCRYGQGYLFSKPLPADQVAEFAVDSRLLRSSAGAA